MGAPGRDPLRRLGGVLELTDPSLGWEDRNIGDRLAVEPLPITWHYVRLRTGLIGEDGGKRLG